MALRLNSRSIINSALTSEVSGYFQLISINCAVFPSTTRRTKLHSSSLRSRRISPLKFASSRFRPDHFSHDDEADAGNDHCASDEGAPAYLFVQDNHAE